MPLSVLVTGHKVKHSSFVLGVNTAVFPLGACSIRYFNLRKSKGNATSVVFDTSSSSLSQMLQVCVELIKIAQTLKTQFTVTEAQLLENTVYSNRYDQCKTIHQYSAVLFNTHTCASIRLQSSAEASLSFLLMFIYMETDQTLFTYTVCVFMAVLEY